MKVYIISDYKTLNPVKEALESVSSKIPLTIYQADYYNIEEEIIPQIIQLIQNADVVIADISNESQNIYYEIGLAHAFGKPVIIVSQMDNFTRTTLITYRFYKYDIGPVGIKQLAFYLEEILKSPKAINELKPNISRKTNPSFNEFSSNTKLNDILSIKNVSAKSMELEKWIHSLLLEIPGFDVVHNAVPSNKEYDFIIWNRNQDIDSERLGNPIPIEIKTAKSVGRNDIQELISRAYKQGFKSFILITIAKRTPAIKALIDSVRKSELISILVIDGDDLEKIENPKDLYTTILKALRDSIIS